MSTWKFSRRGLLRTGHREASTEYRDLCRGLFFYSNAYPLVIFLSHFYHGKHCYIYTGSNLHTYDENLALKRAKLSRRLSKISYSPASQGSFFRSSQWDDGLEDCRLSSSHGLHEGWLISHQVLFENVRMNQICNLCVELIWWDEEENSSSSILVCSDMAHNHWNNLKNPMKVDSPTPTSQATVFDISLRDERQRTINLTDNRQKNIASVGLFLIPFLAWTVLTVFLFSIF